MIDIVHLDLLSPIFLSIWPIKFHYYWLMYAISFLFWYYFLKKELVQKSIISEADLEKLFYWTAIFWIIWGRLWAVIFYNFDYFLVHPIEIFYVWNWWMASHWWFLLWFIWFLLFKPKQINLFIILDLIVIPLVLWLALWRFWNLINWELYWYATNVPWCMNFADWICRHPTQIYAIIKDLFILLSLIIIKYKFNHKLPLWFITSVFLIMYWILRFIVEFFKENFKWNNYFDFITTGQILSILMIFIWIFLIINISRKRNKLLK